MKTGRPSVIVPLGKQRVQLGKELAARLKIAEGRELPDLIARRVWIEQRKGRLFLHVGKVEVTSGAGASRERGI